MEKYQIIEFLKNSKQKNSDLWIAEALFGFSHVKGLINNLKKESNILEVGCGSGILLSILAEEFTHHKFDGIEPFEKGFSSLKNLNDLVRRSGVQIKIETYEKSRSKELYDLIFCINVFEHVEDWKHFLNWALENLNDDGVFLILCPNYGFPFESHFGFPLILNKKITYHFFKNCINKYEHDNDSYGLWNSLNFVKKKDVKSFYKKKNLTSKFKMYDDLTIIDDMVGRMSKDTQFRKRQSFLGKTALFLQKIGIFNFIKFFPNYIPYMKLSFTKNSSLCK